MLTASLTIGPTKVDWGRYREEKHTLESLLFFHPSYVMWMRREFSSDDLIRQRLEDLIADANKRPVVVACDRQVVAGHPCESLATHLSVAGAGRLCNVPGALYVCSDKECRQSFLASAQNGIHFYRLNVDGLSDLARSNVPSYVLELFVQRLAHAWGMKKPEQNLSKDLVHRFFYRQPHEAEPQ